MRTEFTLGSKSLTNWDMFHSADIKKKFLERIEYKTKNAYFYDTNFEIKVKSYFLVY